MLHDCDFGMSVEVVLVRARYIGIRGFVLVSSTYSMCFGEGGVVEDGWGLEGSYVHVRVRPIDKVCDDHDVTM